MYNQGLGDHVIDIAELIISYLVGAAPKDTWNMVNTIGYIVYDDNNIEILVGGEYAPYAPYTNEPWVHKRWKGKKNPNEGWFDAVLKQVMTNLASQYEGVVLTNV